MAKAFVSDLDVDLLDLRAEFSDRFVYSNYFSPLDVRFADGETPMLTHLQRTVVAGYLALNPEVFAKLVPELELPNLIEDNDLTLDAIATGPVIDSDAEERGDGYEILEGLRGGRESIRVEVERLRADVDDARSLMRILDREGGVSTDLVEMLERNIERIGRVSTTIARETEQLERPSSGLGVESKREEQEPKENGGPVGRSVTTIHLTPDMEAIYEGDRDGEADGFIATAPEQQQLDLLLNLLKSELGYLFLDRTRIRPSGFAVGEHLYTLNLAPGEEVVLEQRTYSKRQSTFEEMTEQERQLDLELASSLSTEIQEGFERQQNRSVQSGLNAGANLGANVFGIQVGAQISYSKNVTEASNATTSRSVKDSTTSSQKVASKYRTAHKIDFKVSTEQGFEQTAKRTMRNPNRFTPLNFEYFKTLQVLELTQERYGVRLCWAPCVRDPAFEFVERIRKGREEILRRAEAGVQVPPRPTAPIKETSPPKWVPRQQIEADQWGFWNDMSADYDIAFSGGEGYIWDGDADAVKASVRAYADNVNRPWGYYVVGEPWREGADVKAKVHVGVDWRIGKRGRIYMEAGANFIANPAVEDAEYKQAYEKYEQDVATWQQAVNDALATVRADAFEDAAKWEQTMLAQFNPIGELMNRIITHFFPPAVRDECWEIDFWQNVFDWDSASFALYPGWWAGASLRDWTRDATDFMNASWAKLYVPIKVGFEEQALRWIFAKVVEKQADPKQESEFAKIIKDLRSFRGKTFGDAAEAPMVEVDDEHPLAHGDSVPIYEEKVLSLGRWVELMPTDGTHMEVLQGMSSAEDEISKSDAAGASRARAALAESHEQDVALKKKAVEGMAAPFKVELRIDTDGGGEG